MVLFASSFIVVIFAIYIVAFKKHHFQLLPHEADLDTTSWWISKLSHVIVDRPFPSNSTIGIALGRLSYSLMTRASDQVNLWKEPDLKEIPFEDLVIAVPKTYNTPEDRKLLNAEIQIRVYNNQGSWKDGTKKPVLIWYHGGGCVVGSMDQDHVLSLQLAKETNFIVVNVDYRLAPEYIFPTGVEDSYAAFEWVHKNIHRYGGDKNRIILGGESAGGYMAAAVTSKYLVENSQDNREVSPIIGTYLVYPGLAAVADPTDPDVAQYADTNGLLPMVTVENFRNLYAGTTDIAVRQNYLFAPALTPEHALQRYPPSIFVVAKYDVLTKESVTFANKLKAFGIPVNILTYKSTIHAFFGKEIVSPSGRIAVAESCAALLEILRLN